jgi:hypothetical protein
MEVCVVLIWGKAYWRIFKKARNQKRNFVLSERNKIKSEKDWDG